MFKWFDKIFHPLQTINDIMPGAVDQANAENPADPAGDYQELMELVNILYEKGYSGLDLMKYIEQVKNIEEMKKYQMLLVFNKVKKEFRNEKLFILFILNFMLLRSDYDLENISFM